jgi:dihydroorotase
MDSILIRNAQIVNEGKIIDCEVLIKHGRIFKLGHNIRTLVDHTIDAQRKFLLPGLIDDQVHFREPGLTHKADLYSEPKAAIAGGITSFMEMPNTSPQTLTQALLQEKFDIAALKSLANFSFFMGASNDNLAEVLRTDPKKVCGIKVFMGSSTGNMLVDKDEVLEELFKEAPMLIATHCEQEEIVRRNMAEFAGRYGAKLEAAHHPLIRSSEACYASSSHAVALAKKHGTRLHILHISTAEECDLFDNSLPLSEKRITAEACVHHLWFSDADYGAKGNFIKWNPAVKSAHDRDAIWAAVLDNRIDIIATDHAPHTLEEKMQPYQSAPSGGPLVQHALPAMLEKVKEGRISLERVVEKMCHAPAQLFNVKERGFIREDYWADLVLVDADQPTTVSKSNLLVQMRLVTF